MQKMSTLPSSSLDTQRFEYGTGTEVLGGMVRLQARIVVRNTPLVTNKDLLASTDLLFCVISNGGGWEVEDKFADKEVVAGPVAWLD
jgi:hypothetical protein